MSISAAEIDLYAHALTAQRDVENAFWMRHGTQIRRAVDMACDPLDSNILAFSCLAEPNDADQSPKVRPSDPREIHPRFSAIQNCPFNFDPRGQLRITNTHAQLKR